jgi:hypothetical protein
MRAERSLWRAIRWPLLLLVIAAAGIAVAAVLDRTAAREWALTIGAPALTVLLPVGVVWLLAAVVLYVVRRLGAKSS